MFACIGVLLKIAADKTEKLRSSVHCNSTVVSLFGCDDGWTFYKATEKCYVRLFNASFYEAQFKCDMMGGNLTSIHSKEENEFLAGFASSHVGQNRYAWVGLHNPFRRPEEWRWIDGTSVDFNRDNPETTRINSEGFCALLKVDFASGNRVGSWLGEGCNMMHHSAICSKPVKSLVTAE